MQYVRYLVIVVGLLVLSVAGTAFTMKASQAQPGSMVVGLTPQLMKTIDFGELEKAHNAYLVLKEEERKRQEAEQKRVDAINQFGPWGPDLVGAAETYGQSPTDLYAVMFCESKGDEYADNGIDLGLFQFHPNTFAGTPYGGASIYDGHAQIYAAAWMWSQGRRNEWPVCGA